MSTVFVLGRDDVGIVAEDRDPGYRDGKPFRFYLTECCYASAKGMEWGIGCRACYDECDPALGGLPDTEHRLRPGGDITKFSDYEYVDVGLRLIEVFGDGLPYDEFVARQRHPAANQGQIPALSEYVLDDSRITGFGAL